MTTPLVNGYAIGGPVGPTTQDLLNRVTGALLQYAHNQPTGPHWPLGPSAHNQMGAQYQTPEPPNNTQVAATGDRTSFDTIPLNDSLENNVNFTGGRVNGAHDPEQQHSGEEASSQDNCVDQGRAITNTPSSREILGCVPQARRGDQDRAPNSRLSRPPSGMPDFSHAQYNNSTVQVQEPDTSSTTIGVKPLIQLVVALFLFGASLFSVAAAGGVMAITTEVGKTRTPVHIAWLVVSMVIFLSSAAVLCFVLRGSAAFSWIFGLIQAIRRTLGRARARARAARWNIRSPFTKIRRAAGFRSRSRSRLPHPKEFELDDLEDQPWGRPPTPYPGPARPVPAVATQTRHALPLGFPVPPSGVNRTDTVVSRLTTISFQSDPRSVSPLSDTPPTPPPKPTGLVSRFQSRDPLLPHTVSGASITQSNRASILTTLCDAVQASNPSHNYSPAVSGAARHSGAVQSPKPAYPIERASSSRFREHED